MKIINPATGHEIATLVADTEETVKIKLSRLKEGQKDWKKVPLHDRLACIVRFGEIVQDNLEELAALLTSETGKPLRQSLNEIRGAHNRIVHLKQNAEKWLRDELITTNGDTREQIVYEPLGVIANISAWNFPYNVGYNIFLYALAGGNAVCYKPSEYVSLTGLKFREYLWAAGVPEDVFECVVGSGAVGKLLLESDLNGYFFTGSYFTGRYIAQRAAPKLVPVQLELGGKDPLYIMDDVADVKQAAVNAAEGAFYNNGQSCCAVERIYVQEKIHDEFIRHFLEEVRRYKLGAPTDKDTFIGPLTREPQLQVLEQQVKDAVEKGAVLALGGQRIARAGYYFEPTVLIEVNHGMLVMREESFGPIIGIQKVGSDEEALQLMQDTEYGLTAAIFSQDYGRAQRLMEELNTGTVYWNCCDRVSPNVPWSGRKNSGLGSSLSAAGIRAFVQPKAYHLRG